MKKYWYLTSDNMTATGENNPIDISVIVPVYSAEEFLPACIDSLMRQRDVCLEIILVNDGSTDRSGAIADEYAGRDSRIRVIHRANGGASAARNTGLDAAQGEYIAFVDSDDRIRENSLCELYREAVRYQADAVMVSLLQPRLDQFFDGFYKPVPEEMLSVPVSGREGFINLVKTGAYIPVVWNCLYRRQYLETIHARFEEGIMNEDELWCPAVLCQAGRMVIVNADYYDYRRREGSVMHATPVTVRLDSLFRVIDRLIEFAYRSGFSDEDGELKNRWHVNILKLYFSAFKILSRLQDSSYRVPEHHLDRFRHDSWQMMTGSQPCDLYFRKAKAGLKQYLDWRESDWVASAESQLQAGRKLMLVYNVLPKEGLTLHREDVPADWAITTDRHYFQRADAVVFHLPGLYQVMDNELSRPEGQVWISWYPASEAGNPWIEDPEIRNTFDYWMCYQPDGEQREHPLVRLCRKVDEKQFDRDNVFCPCCGRTFCQFINFNYGRPHLYNAARFRSTYKNTVCPYCLSRPRHRIACHYFDSAVIGENILMFGEEAAVKNYFDRKNCRYTTADLFDRTADLITDIQDTHLPDEQWDLIVCNHVLEHVPDYKKALRELGRILKKDGILEITVPADRNLDTVYEDTAVTSEEDRISIFGQNDHWRIFGNDFEKILAEAGFAVETVDGDTLPVEIGGVTGPADYDDNRVYVCRKSETGNRQ